MRYLPGGGFTALITTACLNTLAFIWLRRVSPSPSLALIILAIGYLPMVLSTAIPQRREPPASDRSQWIWISTWAAAVTVIYFIFLVFPQALSVSQLIIAQSVTPLLAVIVTGDYRTKAGRREPLLRLFPLGILLYLAWIQQNPSSPEKSLSVFAAVCLAFLAAQSSMRRLSKMSQPLWVLRRFSWLALFFIVSTALPLTGFPTVVEAKIWGLGLIAAVFLICIPYGFLTGFAKTAPFLSALAVSSSMPTVFFFEWWINGREVRIVEMVLALLYCVAVTAMAAMSEKTEPLTKPQETPSERVA